MTDPDIQAVVQHATAQAESLYPKRTFSIRHLTHDQFVQQAEALRQQYNQDRANNSTQRTQLNKTNCK
jgi:hypothetical protein